MRTEEKLIVGVGAITLVVAILAIAFFVGGGVLWLAWNYGAVPAFGAPVLAYWPACFLALLLNVIFNRGGASK